MTGSRTFFGGCVGNGAPLKVWVQRAGRIIHGWFALTLLMSTATVASGSTAEEVVQAFFGPSGIDDVEAFYTGEMLTFRARPTLGESLPQGISISIRTLSTSPDEVVFGVTLEGGAHTQDWYAFLEKSNDGWKLAAVRTLALSGIEGMFLDQLATKASRTSEEEWELQNLQLLVASDADLAVFVRSHQQELDDIVRAMENDPGAATESAKKLHINRVERGKRGMVILTIGGALDNSAGFLWVPDGTTPPTISASGYILVENVLGRWYIFKTT